MPYKNEYSQLTSQEQSEPTSTSPSNNQENQSLPTNLNHSSSCQIHNGKFHRTSRTQHHHNDISRRHHHSSQPPLHQPPNLQPERHLYRPNGLWRPGSQVPRRHRFSGKRQQCTVVLGIRVSTSTASLSRGIAKSTFILTHLLLFKDYHPILIS
ncbi:hypothetical protein BDV12DRAFT_3116 [Aspergillus spectabilis]